MSAETVLLWGSVDDAGALAQRLIDSGPVLILIDSQGGSIDTAHGLAHMIRTRRKCGSRTSCLVVGTCQSAAPLIFAACSPRFVCPKSTFLFHGTTVEIETTPRGAAQILAQTKHSDEAFIAQMAEDLGEDIATIQKLHVGDNWLTASQIVARGWAKEWPEKRRRKSRGKR